MKSLYKYLIRSLMLAVLLGSLISSPVKANGTAADIVSYSNSSPLGFFQDWSNTALITTSDDWSGVLSITGYLGEDPSTTANPYGDPQTILTDMVHNDADSLDIIANTVSTSTSGGVGEISNLADPVVALQGSGGADAPYLKIVVNTSGVNKLNISYDIRDVDGSTDNSVQQVALHYRVGSSGDFTNIPEAYIADATTGPSLAEMVTHIDVTLPSAADNQPVVEFRIMTTNAAGGDEWVGIDNIFITANYAPDDYSLSASNILENQPLGTMIGTLAGSDPNNADTHTFALVDSASCAMGSSDNAYFSIADDKLLSNAEFDYESKSTYYVCIQVTDNNGLSITGPNRTVTVLNIVDETRPSVTVERASLQDDPAKTSPVNFIATFSEPLNISTFANSDITLEGTAGAGSASVTEISPNDGTTFNIAVSGMTVSGSVVASIGAGIVQDVDGNVNTASTSTDNTVLYDANLPVVDAFITPSILNSLIIPITTFTMSDDVGVTGYIITELPAMPATNVAGWAGSAPATYIVSANGSYTLYPWVKDAAGNVSAAFNSPANVDVDTLQPMVEGFTAGSVSTSRTIPITLFSASDNVNVTGYLITASSSTPALNAAGWSETSPTTHTVTADGTYTFYPWVKDAAGNVSVPFDLPVSINVDATPPAITSFVRQIPSVNFTSDDSLVFRVTFSEAVANAGISDFVVDGSTTAAVTEVNTISASIYDVTVSGGNIASFNGNVGLNFNTPDIQDMLGNVFVNVEPAADESYTVDNTAPSILSFMRQTPSDSHTHADELTFRVTFNEGVRNVDANDFKPQGSVVSAAINVAAVSASEYDVTLSSGSLAGFNGIAGLDFNSPNITDLAGNTFIAVEPGVDETYVLFQPFYSDPANDGWVLESKEFSNSANTKNAGGSLRVGDDSKNRQYRSLLYFDTAKLPNDLLISKVILLVKKSDITNPAPTVATHGDLVADMKKGFFGLAPLEFLDFSAAGAPINTAGKLKTSDGGTWYQLTLSPAHFKYINLFGVTQFRLRFMKDDDNDKAADFISFFSGDAVNLLDRPHLIVEYTVP